MHRRNLVVRRFGVLSFGLGYFEDGVWIDHEAGDGLLTDAEPEIQAVHAWLPCCPPGADAVLEAISIASEPLERIAVVARSASS